jgi:hypothetical protein
MRRVPEALIVGAAMCCALASGAAARPAVVELFTSQGCSSCPPADAYLGSLSTRSDVIALAFHVTYWDSLGWRDRFALAQSDERQNRYARALHRPSVFTPQLIIDGTQDSLGSGVASISNALNQPREGVAVRLEVEDGQIRIGLSARAGVDASEVVIIAYLRHATSAVGRGENAGRRLDEFNIVRAIRSLGAWKGDARSFQLPIASLPSDATDVAVLIQCDGQRAILGAAARALR